MIRSMILSLSLVLLTACSGCSSNGDTRDNTLATSCLSATIGIRVVTVGLDAGKVDIGTAKRVLAAAERVQPICGAATQPPLDEATRIAFEAAVAEISAARAGLENPRDVDERDEQ